MHSGNTFCFEEKDERAVCANTPKNLIWLDHFHLKCLLFWKQARIGFPSHLPEKKKLLSK